MPVLAIVPESYNSTICVRFDIGAAHFGDEDIHLHRRSGELKNVLKSCRGDCTTAE